MKFGKLNGKFSVFEFFAVGKGSFPVDQLRRGCCWPESSEDLNSALDDEPDYNRARVIKLNGTVDPETQAGRWNSFGWAVVPSRADANALVKQVNSHCRCGADMKLKQGTFEWPHCPTCHDYHLDTITCENLAKLRAAQNTAQPQA